MSLRSQLQASIAALENQRDVLGDAVVDAAQAPLRAKLAALGQKSKAGASEQQLKQLTMLFVDTVDSTAMGQRLDPEDLHNLLDTALNRLAVVVQNHHGRVLSYTGDGLLAAFGAEESREEDPENAVRAGLAVLEHARDYATEVARTHGVTGFNIRAGVHTGAVLLGGGAGGTVRGDAVNIAARLEKAAPAGGLRISHDTYRHVRGVFDVLEEPALTLKGVAEPVRSYLVQRAKPRAFRVAARGIEGVETPMIGRDAELAVLQDAFLALHRPGADNATRCVTVIADAGVGKSRLLYEFENWAEARPEKFVLFKGRAQPSTRQQPFGLLRDIFAWRLQIAESDHAEVARGKLLAHLAPLAVVDSEAELHILGHLIGLDFSDSPQVRGILGDPRQVRSRGFHAAAKTLRYWGRAQGAPSVLLLEDLHWSDDGSLDFLRHLLAFEASSPLMMLGSARPAIEERHPGWPALEGGHTRISMATLDRASRNDLANVLLRRFDEVPASLRNIISSGGDGNPFFMEELVKMLIDDGAIVTEPERWSVATDKLLAAKVPSTLTGVLQARLDGLPHAERAALQAASVLGFVFWNRALAALDADCVKALPALARRELVIRQASSAVEGAHEYTFKHHILHQVVYDSQLKQRKRELHARAAAWFAKLSSERGGEHYGATASHCERAGDNSAALKYFSLAADAAAQRHASEAVLDYVKRALALCGPDDLAVRWRLTAAREKILAFHDDQIGHAADLDALERIADALGDDGLRVDAALRRARAHVNAGDFHLVEAVATHALGLAHRIGAQAAAIQAYGVRATALRRMSQYQKARELAQKGLELARATSELSVQAELCSSLSAICAESGYPAEGFAFREESLALFRQVGDLGAESQTLNALGDSLVRIGSYAAAGRACAEALQLARRIGRRDAESIVNLNLAAIALLQGDHVNARELALEACRIAASIGARDLEAASCLPLGLAELGLGEYAQARAALVRSRDLFLQNSSPHYALEPMVALAVTALAEGDAAAAMTHLQPALEHLDAGGVFHGAEEPMRMRLMCHQVLDAAGDARARDVLRDAHAHLMASAQRIDDPDLRRRYLDDVPHHRAITVGWRAQVGVE